VPEALCQILEINKDRQGVLRFYHPVLLVRGASRPCSKSSPCLPSRFPFHELENVVMTPHCASWTRESLDAQVAFVADNLLRFRAGQPLRALVDLDLGY
jgi:hypothetical protein